MLSRQEQDTIIGSIGKTYIDKTYEMPKSFVSYRKPRQLSDEQREVARNRIIHLAGNSR